jgi:CheY-like chemotaxis protein
MTSVAFASHTQSALSDEPCSDLNQVVARAEALILEAVGDSLSLQLALSPNVARVAVTVADLQKIVVELCVDAASTIGSGGRLIIETRGLNDAKVEAQVATEPSLDAANEACARLVVRAERGPAPSPVGPRKAALRPEAPLGAAALEALLEGIGGRLERVPVAESGLARVVHLPYVSAANSSGRMPVASTRGGEVILLVEDEPQVQAVTARILRAFGYSVITAHNERTALAQAEQYGASISLVVSDLVLPGVSGTDLVRRLRQPCEHARVLYMSGYSPEHVGALVEGASFLRKPFTAQELVTMVRELLAASVH